MLFNPIQTGRSETPPPPTALTPAPWYVLFYVSLVAYPSFMKIGDFS